MGPAWRALLGRLPPPSLWAAVWLAALAVSWAPVRLLLFPAPALWLSAFLLAPGRPQGRRLVTAAAGVCFFWAALISFQNSAVAALQLAVRLALGLHLILAYSPLKLALAAVAPLALILGLNRARKLALSLALLARLPFELLTSALSIRTALNYRAAGLPPVKKLILWGRALLRDALVRDEDLARALAKRRPWPDF